MLCIARVAGKRVFNYSSVYYKLSDSKINCCFIEDTKIFSSFKDEIIFRDQNELIDDAPEFRTLPSFVNH